MKNINKITSLIKQNHIKIPTQLLISSLLIGTCLNGYSAENYNAYIIIYGDTSAAVISAIQAKKEGQSVILMNQMYGK